MVEFVEGLKYPWGNPKKLWNILWVLVPILGIFALIGYVQKIMRSIVGGDVSGLPEFGNFMENLKNGFVLFLKMIPIMVVVVIVNMIPFIGWFAYLLITVFFLPWLMINLFVKDTLKATFEFEKAAKAVFGNFVEYIIAYVKTIVYAIIYGLLSLVLVGIPCLQFGQNIYLADFYAKTSTEAAEVPKKK
ncbi:DUF4013 domain-containing protein [Candidatus Woesearchaeota archaeon]|nr:DUF4013 domain-containing protein [Candidatus Woesearchaeota archaeon]